MWNKNTFYSRPQTYMCYKNTFVHLIIIINITVIQTVIYTYSNFLLFEKVSKLKWDTSKSKRPLKSQTRLTRPLSNIFHSMFEFGRFLKPDWRVGRMGECLVQISLSLSNVDKCLCELSFSSTNDICIFALLLPAMCVHLLLIRNVFNYFELLSKYCLFVLRPCGPN